MNYPMRNVALASSRLAFAAMLFLPCTVGAQSAPGFKVPPGFEVTEFADGTLANDIYTMTVDPKGRIVVAGKGYIRILVDTKGTGRADKAIAFAESPKDGAMGLLWEGDTLYVSGDGGLRKFTTVDGDHADGTSALLRTLKTGREHGAHEIRRGPDGWLYVLCGNDTAIDASYAQLPTSPVTKPVAGCVLRFTPDLKKSEIVAHGFRNPYSMDFNSDGELFTYDSDNERCVSLPWYEPTRFYHVIPGGFYGWLNPQYAQFWRCPPYFVDIVAPAVTLGRGSPTGVACYRHVAFPKKYHGGMFAADWTFGKVYFLELSRDGSSYTAKKEVFLESVGDNGFAPTALVVQPQTGDLFISIGGRGTRGAVYRVHHKNAPKKFDKAALAKLQFAPRSLDWQPALLKSLPKQAQGPDKHERLKALQIMTRHADEYGPGSPLIRAAIEANWEDTDRYLRQAAAALITKRAEAEQQTLFDKPVPTYAYQTFALSRAMKHPGDTFNLALDDIPVPYKDWKIRLDAVRLLQMAIGDLVNTKKIGQVWEGYSPRLSLTNILKPLNPKKITKLYSLGSVFPTGHPELDFELARTFALLEDPDQKTLAKVSAKMAATESVVEQVHYLIVLGRLTATRDSVITTQIATALLNLDAKLDAQGLLTDTHWTMRLRELYTELAKKDSKLNGALLHHMDFGRPAHALFALTSGFDAPTAADIFLKKAKANKMFAWDASVVTIVGKLPAEQSFSVLRPLWGKAGLDAAILPILAKHPAEQDRGKFVTGLKSPQLSVVTASLQALKKLPGKADGEEFLALLTALNRLPKDKAKTLAQDLAGHLEMLTGQNHGTDRAAWTAWFETAYPKLAAKLTNIDGVDVAAWKKRFAQLKLDGGDAKLGAAVFQKANCATCHSGNQALGPDLHGVGKRFGPDDLLWAIVQPSKDVPERYQTTLFETKQGKIYQGLIVYEATDGVLLQTGATTTVRIPGDQIASQQHLPNSLMPAGLLDNLSNHEVADLFAFLRGL